MRPSAAALRSALGEARRGLSVRRRRVVLTALGIVLATAMLSAAVVVADGLGQGFDRAARAADLPDLIVRFDQAPASEVSRRLRSLPDVAGYATRTEVTNVDVAAAGAGHRRGDAVAEVLGPGRRQGYAVVAGRRLPTRGRGVLVEDAFARAWGLHPGSTLDLGELGPQPVLGLVQAPDNVGFPLAKPRFYISRATVDARFGVEGDPRVDYAELWLRDPRYLDEVLVQARASSFGLRDLRFATRSGVRVFLDQAAGIVIDLLVALSLIALATAGAMLAASARAEVQRRLGTIGVQRAIGATGGHVTRVHAIEAALVAAPAGAIGCAAGVLAIYGPSARLLSLLNEPAPGSALVLPLIGTWLAAVALAVAGAAWPAWRAAARPVVSLLRGADITRRRPLGAARRAATTALGPDHARRSPGDRAAGPPGRDRDHARALDRLRAADARPLLRAERAAHRSDHARQALRADRRTAPAMPPGPSAGSPASRPLPPRYDVQAVDSFSLGQTIELIAYPGNHVAFEAPQLVSGHRLRGSGQVEIGQGLAQAAGLSAGQTLAVALPSGASCGCGSPAWSAPWTTTGTSPTCRPQRCCGPTPPPRRCWPSASIRPPTRVRSATRCGVSAPCPPRPAVPPPAARRWSPSCGRSSGRWRSSTGSSACTR